jgi:muramidase (phage lysozyme)
MSQWETNEAAFLELIAFAEGTSREKDPYAVCYGYKHTIKDFSNHPTITGEWEGEKLPDEYCRKAGFSPGCKSTAAGKYQIIRPTWLGIKKKLFLRDFGRVSQDKAALELLRSVDALDDIRSGQLASAVRKARSIWASLPGANYGQPERRLTDLQAVFTKNGGILA